MSNPDDLQEQLEQLLWNKMLFEEEFKRMHKKQMYSPGVMRDCKRRISALNKEIKILEKKCKKDITNT